MEEKPTHSCARRVHHTPQEAVDVSRTSGTQKIVRAVADGTGLSEEEVWIKAGWTVLVAALLGFVHAVEFVTDLATDVRRMAAPQ